MLLEQAASKLGVEGQTPWLATILGWAVTLIAALIPCLFNWKDHAKLKKEISKLREAQSHAIDKTLFNDQRQKLIRDLITFQKAIDKGVYGGSTLHRLEASLVKIQSYADRLIFCDEDKKAINSLLLHVQKLQKPSLAEEELRPAQIQVIIEILNKGANRL